MQSITREKAARRLKKINDLMDLKSFIRLIPSHCKRPTLIYEAIRLGRSSECTFKWPGTLEAMRASYNPLTVSLDHLNGFPSATL